MQTYPTQDSEQAASVEQIRQVRKAAGHTTASKVAPKIFEQLHQPSALALIVQLLPLVAQLADYDEEIEQLFLSHEDNEVFCSLPGAGKRLAPRLLAEIGDEPSRYETAASVQALGGTSPVLFQSGTYSKPHRRQGCIKPLRNALHSFAWQSTRQEPWAAGYYERKRAEGKSHSVAVRALSNIWVRIIFAMLQSQKPYDRATFEMAKHRHAPKVA